MTDKLQPLTDDIKSAVRNSAHLIDILKELRINDSDILVSFDVTSLFTMVPVDEAATVIRRKLCSRGLTSEWADLAEFCLTSTFFQYREQLYAQVEGAAMGSPLSPVVANLFMEAFETEALENAPLKPTVWLRYVDDTLVVWPHGPHTLADFLQHLNNTHPKIKFTMEVENEGKLPFLDVLVSRKANGRLGHSVYRKPTHTNRYLHAGSHHHPATKRGVLKTLAIRAIRVCDKESLDSEMELLKTTFRANGYSASAANQAVRQATTTSNTVDITTPSDNTNQTIATLPYIRGVTDKIGKLLSRFDIKTAYKAQEKLGQKLVRVKDRVPPLMSSGVYEIPCSCGHSYIGETGRTVDERLREHIRHYKYNNTNKSAIALHAWKTGHAILFDDTRLLAREDRWGTRRVKEAVEIIKHPHNLNADQGIRLHDAWKHLFYQDVRSRTDAVLAAPLRPVTDGAPSVNSAPRRARP